MNRVSLYLWILMLYVSRQVSAQTDPNFLPGPVPDRIILTWQGNPATSQAVTWRTDSTVIEAFVEISPADPRPSFTINAMKVKANTEALKVEGVLAHFHSVNLTQLQPGTLYAYRVGAGDHWSEWFQFSTGSEEPKPFSFIYFGDAQNDIKSLWSRTVRSAYSKMPDADFMLHAGDLVNNANNNTQWGEWFYAGSWMLASMSNIATPGNHEYHRIKGTSDRKLSDFWRPTFTLPENGPSGLEESVYYIDYQGVRFISINTQAMGLDTLQAQEQLKWLEATLADNPNHWTVVTHHHPVYASSWGRDNSRLRQALQPIYNKYKVDLVLQGHDHSYGRGRNVAEGTNVKEQNSPVYVVSVSGPKMYPLNFEPWTDRAATNIQLYQVITVDGNELKYRAYTAVNQLYDAFTLRKETNDWAELIDEQPRQSPEMVEPTQDRIKRLKQQNQFEEYQKRFEAFKERRAKERQ